MASTLRGVAEPDQRSLSSRLRTVLLDRTGPLGAAVRRCRRVLRQIQTDVRNLRQLSSSMHDHGARLGAVEGAAERAAGAAADAVGLLHQLDKRSRLTHAMAMRAYERLDRWPER